MSHLTVEKSRYCSISHRLLNSHAGFNIKSMDFRASSCSDAEKVWSSNVEKAGKRRASGKGLSGSDLSFAAHTQENWGLKPIENGPPSVYNTGHIRHMSSALKKWFLFHKSNSLLVKQEQGHLLLLQGAAGPGRKQSPVIQMKSQARFRHEAQVTKIKGRRDADLPISLLQTGRWVGVAGMILLGDSL